jgi:hypothetical protein
LTSIDLKDHQLLDTLTIPVLVTSYSATDPPGRSSIPTGDPIIDPTGSAFQNGADHRQRAPGSTSAKIAAGELTSPELNHFNASGSKLSDRNQGMAIRISSQILDQLVTPARSMVPARNHPRLSIPLRNTILAWTADASSAAYKTRFTFGSRKPCATTMWL